MFTSNRNGSGGRIGRATFEHLEPRRLASFTSIEPDDGVLRIDGTKGNDQLEVWELDRGRKLAVRRNGAGKLEWHHLKGVKEIVIETGRGDDRVRLGDCGVRCSVYGGRGNDQIDGSPGADVLEGGLGDDTISGNNGDDTLVGGRGNDNIVGDGGVDELLGGPGIDVAFADDLREIVRDVETLQRQGHLIEIEPTPDMIGRLKLLQDERSATAMVEFLFPDSRYRVTSLRAKCVGNEIRIECGVAEHQGASLQAVVHEQRRIPLGDLPDGPYALVVVSRGGEELARRPAHRSRPARDELIWVPIPDLLPSRDVVHADLQVRGGSATRAAL